MSKGIMGNGHGGFESARCFRVMEENRTKACSHASLFSLHNHLEPKSSTDKLSLSIGIVVYV